MKYFSFVFSALFLVYLGVSPAVALAQMEFTTNIRLGDRGPHVRELQRVLNSVPGIQIAIFGAGSPGMETDYFGPLTERAVIAFQNKYASDVLYPIGLTQGTGFVGSMTRDKLNALRNNSSFDMSGQNTPEPYVSIARPEDVELPSTLSPQNSDENEEKSSPFFAEMTQAEFAKGGTLEQIDDLSGGFERIIPRNIDGDNFDIENVRQFSEGLNLGFIGDVVSQDVIGSINTLLGVAGVDNAVDQILNKLGDLGISGRPFGGRVVYHRRCNCSIGHWLVIGPPNGGLFHFIPSQQFREFNIPRTGVWTLGLHYPGGRCRIVTGDSCTTLPTDGLIPGFIGSSN